MVHQCARDLERSGHYGQATLKSDHQSVIVDVWKEIANLRVSRGTLPEHSPVADSQSNGFIERGIKSVEEMTRMSPLAGVSVDCRAHNGHPEQMPCGDWWQICAREIEETSTSRIALALRDSSDVLSLLGRFQEAS